MDDILAKTVRPTGQTVESLVGDEIVLLHLESGAYFGLDTIGSRIWELLKDGATPRAICERLCEEYEAGPEAIEADVRRLLEDLEANRIVEAA